MPEHGNHSAHSAGATAAVAARLAGAGSPPDLTPATSSTPAAHSTGLVSTAAKAAAPAAAAGAPGSSAAPGSTHDGPDGAVFSENNSTLPASAAERPAASQGNSPFLVGTAISVYQNSGGANTNWSEFEQQKKAFGRPTILHGDKCGVASDFWNRYEEDIALTKGLNSTCFRFSIEWGRIEPQRGQVDRAAVQRYHQIFDCLDRHQLEPVVTLYHFVHPSWFEALGGFTKEDSIALFVAYAETVFREFGSRARLWVTFNEPGVQAFCQYIYGVFPPAKIANFATAGRHYMHMLRAHTATYNAIKSLPGGSAAQVGLVHNFMRYEAAGAKSFSGYYVGPLCKWLEHFWGTQITVQYFKTGKFTWACPMGPTLSYQEPSIPGIDFVGLNYYGRVLINWKFEPVGQPGELMTDMPFPLYAPGLYEGIAAMSALGVPVYITETGVADSQGDRRQAFLDTYIPQVERAVRDGFDVRGFMYWTVVDNFEWDHGYHIKFGLYEWNPDGSQARSETASARQLRQIYSGWPARIAAIHGEAREARAAVPAV